MPYTPYRPDWKDLPDTTTPIDATFLEYIEAGLAAAAAEADAAIPAPAGLAADEVLIWTGAVWDAIKLTAANLSATAGITRGQLTGVFPIVNADIDPAAAIAYSKLALAGSIVNADISASAAIAKSKLNLALAIVNADISASAAIAYSKLNLATSIVNGDIATAAAIAVSKLAAGSNGALLKTSGGSPAWSSAGGSGAVPYGTGSDIAWSDTPASGEQLRAVGSVPTWALGNPPLDDVGPLAIGNTAAETSLYSFSVPANALSTLGKLRLQAMGEYLNNTGVARSIQIKVKFGGVTIFDDVTPTFAASATSRPFLLDLLLANLSLTNSQFFHGVLYVGTLAATVAGIGDAGTDPPLNATIAGSASADTTSAQTLDITISHPVASASLVMTRKHAALELIA